MNKKYSNKNNKGFTLLEMIVSMGIFTIVAVIAVGSLVRITSLNRQAQSLQAATNNINYILESMSREMRVGSDFHCVDGAVYNGGNLTYKACDPNIVDKGILFTSANLDNNGCNLIYGYWFQKIIGNVDTWMISKSQQTVCGTPIRRDQSMPLVDTANVSITGIDFDAVQGGLGYSRFNIELSGHAGIKDKEKIDFRIRTMISQRIKD